MTVSATPTLIPSSHSHPLPFKLHFSKRLWGRISWKRGVSCPFNKKIPITILWNHLEYFAL